MDAPSVLSGGRRRRQGKQAEIRRAAGFHKIDGITDSAAFCYDGLPLVWKLDGVPEIARRRLRLLRRQCDRRDKLRALQTIKRRESVS